MEREQAVAKLKELQGQDLRALADKYQVTVWRGDKKNKGWAGHVLERYLGLPINSSQSPNFGSWELKIVPLKRNSKGDLQVKETMAITMIDAYNVSQTPFEQSHLLSKLRKAVVCARVFESQKDDRSLLASVSTFNLDDPKILNQVKADYELVRATITAKGFDELTGAMGVLVQPRTKGPGHGSTSRAFYARTRFVTTILGL
jgi:DNA mismatch repair protein MutH